MLADVFESLQDVTSAAAEHIPKLQCFLDESGPLEFQGNQLGLALIPQLVDLIELLLKGIYPLILLLLGKEADDLVCCFLVDSDLLLLLLNEHPEIDNQGLVRVLGDT